MKIFIDSSVVIAALLSPGGGSAQTINFCEIPILDGYISLDVIGEVKEVIERKLPGIHKEFEKLLKIASLKVVKKISPPLLRNVKRWLDHPKDAKILAAAKMAHVDCLVSLDIKHFIKDPRIAEKAQIKILTPGDFLKFFRKELN